MRALLRLNIEKRLLIILAGISAVSLLMAASVLLVYENLSLREQLVRELNIMAEIIADRSSAALVFSDADTANGNLASLAAQTSIIYACIRTDTQVLFAEYRRSASHDNLCITPSSDESSQFSSKTLDVFRHIELDGNHLGILHIRSDLSEFHKRIQRDVVVMFIIFLLALAFAYVAAKRLVTLISGPITNLASMATTISDSQDFSLRAKKYSDDEIGTLVDAFNNMLKHIQFRDSALQQEKIRVEQSALQSRKFAEETRVSNLELGKEIDVRKQVEEKLQELNDSLEQRVIERTSELKALNDRIGEVARSAGMAEVASGVLHNVGNVLNSVNVSSSVIREMVRKSRASNLERVAGLMQEHMHDIGQFLTQDPKGSRLPEFISLLSQQLQQEKEALFKELDVLANNIDHIKNVISMQQSYAGNYGLLEKVAVTDLLEDALRINYEGMERQGIQIERQYLATPEIHIDKHKILQILINLISNAKHALVDAKHDRKHLRLKISEKDQLVCIEVSDNGVGIAAEDMAHLFEYGFKKRKGGHGYGLHHSALTANELSGQIAVHSDGLGKGATFSLLIPRNND